MEQPDISLIIPIYNEEQTLPELYRRLCSLFEELDASVEVIFVDDGSRDRSGEILQGLLAGDSRLRLVRLSRNFGHQVAITAGMDYSSGRAVIIMDADLQDPPEVVREMIARWREGYEVVYGIREERRGETFFKRFTASLYYGILRRLTDMEIPEEVGDFRLADRKVIDSLRGVRERNRYVRGLFSWVGFRQTGVRYVRAERFSGKTHYPVRKMLKLAVDGIIGFSYMPLRLALNLGFLVSGFSFFYGISAVVHKLMGGPAVTGWTSMIVAVFMLGGIQLIILGIMGEYLARMYDEVKHRPLYIVDRLTGFSGDVSPGGRERDGESG